MENPWVVFVNSTLKHKEPSSALGYVCPAPRNFTCIRVFEYIQTELDVILSARKIVTPFLQWNAVKLWIICCLKGICWFYEGILRERKSDGNSTSDKSWWSQIFEERGNKLLTWPKNYPGNGIILSFKLLNVEGEIYQENEKNAQLISVLLCLR